MPEPLLLAKVVALAAILAGIVQLLAWWIFGAITAAALRKGSELPQNRSGDPNSMKVGVGGALGVGIGFVAGVWALGQWPHWPPPEDRDRFLTVLLPAAILVEIFAALPRVSPWLAWAMRLVLSAASVPILLYATIYLAELTGPGSREWTDQQMAAWLTGLPAALAVVWIAAVRLLRTDSGRFLPFALALTVGGAGVTVMLSGYRTGGELALPLAGAVGGAALAALGLRMLKCNAGAMGVGLVGLFGLLIMGRFSGGEMTTLHGAILLAAPLLVCVPELLPRKVSSSWLRSAVAIVVIVIPIALVVTQAREKFMQASGTSSNPGEATGDDYLEYK